MLGVNLSLDDATSGMVTSTSSTRWNWATGNVAIGFDPMSTTLPAYTSGVAMRPASVAHEIPSHLSQVRACDFPITTPLPTLSNVPCLVQQDQEECIPSEICTAFRPCGISPNAGLSSSYGGTTVGTRAHTCVALPRLVQKPSSTLPYNTGRYELREITAELHTLPPIANVNNSLDDKRTSDEKSDLTSGRSNHLWDIKDVKLPRATTYDPYELWPTGHCRRIYTLACERARRHQSGWAMRNTNNHNPQVLKKSCLGVLECSAGCTVQGKPLSLRPAICDKARKKQTDRACITPGCPGRLVLRNCRGHSGYPVTHFWRFANGAVYFEAKGEHDHTRPSLKTFGMTESYVSIDAEASSTFSRSGSKRASTTHRFDPIDTSDLFEKSLRAIHLETLLNGPSIVSHAASDVRSPMEMCNTSGTRRKQEHWHDLISKINRKKEDGVLRIVGPTTSSDWKRTRRGRRQRSFLGSEHSHRSEACGLIESALTSMETSIPLANRLCSLTGDRSITSSSSFSAENHTEAMESTNQIVCSPYWLISPTQSYSNRYSKMEEEPVSIASQSRQQGESFCLNPLHANPTQQYCSSEVAMLTCNHPSCSCLGLPYLSEDSNYTTVPEMCSSPASVRSPKWSSSTSSLSNSSSRTYQTPTHLSVASVVSSVQLEVGPGNPMNVQPTASPSFRPLERTYETVSSYDHNTYPMKLGVDFVPDPTAQQFPGPVGMDTKSHMNMSGATLNEAPDTPKGLAQNEEGRDTEFVWNTQFTHSTACASSEGQPVYWTVDSFSDDLIQISGFGYTGVLDSNDYGEQSYRSHAHIHDALYDSGGGKRTTPSGCPNPLASEDARSNIFRWSDTSAFSALTSLGDTEPFMVCFQEQDKQNTDARTCSSGSRPQWVETPRGAHWFTDDAQQEACATGTYEKPDILEATEATYEPIDYLVERLDPQTTVTFVEAGSARFIHSVDTQSWTNTAKTDFGTCINTLGSIGP